MLENQKVIIKKISASEYPKYKTASKEEWVPGKNNPEGKTIPVEYEIEGVLLEPVSIGKSVRAWRSKRNGVEAEGIFQTSKVISLTWDRFETMNSIYSITYIID